MDASQLRLKVPCKNCPFADRPERIRFACRERAEEIEELAYRQGFPCHLSAEEVESFDGEETFFEFGEKTQHCAGAIGMFLNDGYDSTPGTDNESLDDGTFGDWSEAQKVAFLSVEDFLAANEAERGDR